MTENLLKPQKCQFKSCGFNIKKSEECQRKGGLCLVELNGVCMGVCLWV